MYSYLIIGLPNSGKTTFSEKFFSKVLHYDEIRNLNTFEKHKLYYSYDVIEGVFNTKKGRKIVLNRWKNKEYKICIWINTSIDVCLSRADKCRSIDTVLHHKDVFEIPSINEGWDEIIVIRNLNKYIKI